MIQKSRSSHGSSSDELRNQPPFSIIWQRLGSFPRQQRHFAEHLLHSPELVIFGSIRDVAKSAGVNIATITRFVASIGFDGYRAFQTALRLAYMQRAGIGQTVTDSEAALRSPADAVSFARSQQEANMQAALANFASIDSDAIAAVLSASRRVFIMAEGAAVSVGILLSKYLHHCGIASDVLTGEIDAATALRNGTESDVFVAIATGITFRASVAMSVFARERNIKIIAIVGNPISPLLAHADYRVVAPAQSPALLVSVFAMVGIIELLVSNIAGRRGVNIAGEKKALFDMYLDERLVAPLEEDGMYPAPIERIS